MGSEEVALSTQIQSWNLFIILFGWGWKKKTFCEGGASHPSGSKHVDPGNNLKFAF